MIDLSDFYSDNDEDSDEILFINADDKSDNENIDLETIIFSMLAILDKEKSDGDANLWMIVGMQEKCEMVMNKIFFAWKRRRR